MKKTKADSAVLINGDGTTSNITGLDLIPIVGGVACGCPYNMSISYKIFNELKEVAQPDDYRQGQLTLYAEEEGIRLANSCNTLQALNTTFTEDMKALTIAEGMYRVENDTIKCFRQGYKGKFKNSYSNQCLFYSAYNSSYIKELERLEVLDASYDNFIETDVETQRNAWLAKGNQEASDWDDDKVRQMTLGNVVYARIHAKLLDAMEGFDIVVEMT